MKLHAIVAALGLPFMALSALAHDHLSTLVDGAGVEVSIPAHPQRIVALHDSAVTVPLLELGVVPVGSHGRLDDDGKPYIRSGMEITGYDFSNSDIVFVGDDPADIELIASLEPDLIISTSWQETPVDQLRALAPTYWVNFDTVKDDFELYELLAEITGTQARLATLKARYQAQIEMIRELVGDPSQITVNVIQPRLGQLRVWRSYFALGKVLRDVGFSFPELTDSIEGVDGVDFSGEVLPAFDADLLFINYAYHSFNQTPDVSRAEMKKVLPAWCEQLHACRQGQVIFVPMSMSSSATYEGLSQATQVVLSQVAGRDFVPMKK